MINMREYISIFPIIVISFKFILIASIKLERIRAVILKNK